MMILWKISWWLFNWRLCKRKQIKYKTVNNFLNNGINDLFQEVAESIFENYINSLDKQEKPKLFKNLKKKYPKDLKLSNIYLKYLNY